MKKKIIIDCRIVEKKELFGIQRALVEMLRAVFVYDLENEYILFFDNTEIKDFVMKEFEDIQKSCTIAILPFGLRGLKNLLFLSGVIGRYSPDIYFLPFHFMNNLMPRRYKVVLTVYDLIPYLYPNQKMSLINKLFHRVWLASYLIFKRADAIVTSSEQTSRDLIKKFKVDEHKVHKILLGNTASVVHVDRNVAKLHIAKQFGIDRPYILYVGRNEPHKNIKGLISAYALLPQFIRDKHYLVLAGKQDERYSADIASHIRSLGVGGGVKILGFVQQEDLSALYSGAEVFVLPSFYEGFGIPILEAFAARVPVVATNQSSVPEVAGEAALYAHPTDPKQIASQIHALLGNELLAAQMVKKGTTQLEKFSWDQSARELVRVFNQCI